MSRPPTSQTPNDQDLPGSEQNPIEARVVAVWGRPTVRDEGIIDLIIERVTEGVPLAQVLRGEGMPSVSAFYNWLNKDEELDGRFARAREFGHDAIAAESLSIVDTTPERTNTDHGDKVDSGHVAWLKNRAEQRMKLLAKWDRRYADKQQVEHSGKLSLESLVAGDE